MEEHQNSTIHSNLVRKSNRTVKSCRLLEQLRELNLQKNRKEVARPTAKKDKENNRCVKNHPIKSLTTSTDAPMLTLQVNQSGHHKVNSLIESKRHFKTSSNVLPGSGRPSTRY